MKLLEGDVIQKTEIENGVVRKEKTNGQYGMKMRDEEKLFGMQCFCGGCEFVLKLFCYFFL